MSQFLRGFPGDSDSKESACTAGDPGLIPGLERSPGKGIGCPLQYSCLENPMDTGAWQATVHGVAKNRTLATDTFTVFVDQESWQDFTGYFAQDLTKLKSKCQPDFLI